MQDDHAAVTATLTKADKLFRATGDQVNVARYLRSLANSDRWDRKKEEAIFRLEDAEKLYRTISDAIGLGLCALRRALGFRSGSECTGGIWPSYEYGRECRYRARD